MTVLLVIITASAILLTVGIRTITMDSHPHKKGKHEGKVIVKVRHAGVPHNLLTQEESRPEVIQVSEQDLLLDSLEEDPLSVLSREDVTEQKRLEVLDNLRESGYVIKQKPQPAHRGMSALIEEDVFGDLDANPCDELLEAPLDEFRDADYQ